MPREARHHIPLTDIVIAHISDPHFGSAQADSVWTLVAQELRSIHPDLILVTGDLVHTPRERLYRLAQRRLDSLSQSTNAKYYVCAGNHDRHWMGNRIGPLLGLILRHPFRSIPIILWLLSAPILLCILLGSIWLWWALWLLLAIITAYAAWRVGTILFSSWVAGWFNTTFRDQVLTETPKVIPLTPASPGRTWHVGLSSTDSSLRGRMLACGYIDESILDDLRNARCDCDVSIFLVHHHLLSIAALEGDSRTKWRHLLNATSLVNAGRVLEALTEAHIDLVLHGHEHASNYAGYLSAKLGRALRVVAAGSATGNDSFEGCQRDDATFNILVLSADSSIYMHEYVRDKGRWKIDIFPLLDAGALRHSQRRRAAKDERPIVAEITKSLTFTQDRDIWVRWVYTNTTIDGRVQLTQTVRNSTGEPDNVLFEICGPGIQRVRLPGEPKPTADHTWQLISSQLPAYLSGHKEPVQINLVYRWRGGGLLTRQELDAAVDSQRQEPLRTEGYEFAVVRAPDEHDTHDLLSLELIITLPPEYSPTTDPIVRIDDKLSDPELERQLRVLAPGLFVLRIPFPEKGRDYQVAWNPPDEAAVRVEGKTLEQTFCDNARSRGVQLLHSFTQVISATPLENPVSVAIYVKADHKAQLQRVALVGPTLTLPSDVDLLDPDEGVARAWRGDPTIEAVTSPHDPAQNLLVISLPIRFSFQTVGPPPWGVVAAACNPGNINPDWLTEPKNHDRLWEILFPAVAAIMSEAFRRS